MNSIQRLHPAFALLLPGAAVAALGLSFGFATASGDETNNREPHTVQEDLGDVEDPEEGGGDDLPPTSNPNPFVKNPHLSDQWWRMYSRITPWEVPQSPRSYYYFRLVPADAELQWSLSRQNTGR